MNGNEGNRVKPSDRKPSALSANATKSSVNSSSIEEKVEILQEAVDDLRKQNVLLSRFIERQSIGFPMMRIYNAIIEFGSEGDDVLFHDDYPGLFWIDDYSINGDTLNDDREKAGIIEMGHGKVMRGPFTFHELHLQDGWWARAAELQICSGDFVYF